MKDPEIDSIMKRHMKNTNHTINVDHSVMNRIKKYEEKKAIRILYLEYALSAIVLFSGIVYA